MRKKILEHLYSFLFVTILLGLLYIRFIPDAKERLSVSEEIQRYLEQPFIDFDNPFDRALLRDMLNIYEPGQEEAHDSLLADISKIREQQIYNLASRSGQRVSLAKILSMYIKFIALYILLMAMIYYGVQTIAVYRFVRKKQGRQSFFAEVFMLIKNKPSLNNWTNRLHFSVHIFKLSAKGILTGVLYLMLFSPAYVLAYSIKSDFNTSSDFFILFLGLLSNGLLVNYANKFYAFLNGESRKGYVQTARVKNLENSYSLRDSSFFSSASLFALKKSFSGHVFDHIFMNARRQYISAIKEQASFLISGLIIIEMALNIHDHLSYELLRQILYKNYDIVIIIFAGIFYLVKATEVVADYFMFREENKIAN